MNNLNPPHWMEDAGNAEPLARPDGRFRYRDTAARVPYPRPFTSPSARRYFHLSSSGSSKLCPRFSRSLR
jgi:hypothetical protein